jgi:hypothetical protein
MTYTNNPTLPANAVRNDDRDMLQFASYLRHGLGNGTDLAVLKDYSLWYWRNHLGPYFYREELLVIPYIGTQFFPQQLLKEHEDIRDLILTLDKNLHASLFSILATFIEYHVQFKQRHLASFIEKNSIDPECSALQYGTANQSVSAGEWKNAFWTRK